MLDRATFECLFGTPLGLDIGAAARLYGLAPGNWPEFRRELCRGIGSTGTSVVELVTDRERNVVQHRAVWPAVASAVRPLVASA
jgi:2-succinyl-5-enolpyruvyl-6-hydroxy-3-cyclohexene-1-carboxylate synthase